MEYIKNEDYSYIINKYHDSTAPFDGHNRFIRRDEIFEESTGLSPEEIYDGILDIAKNSSHLLHSVRKAKAFEYVLKNTRISCDCRDIFPAINMIDRPLNATIIKKWRREAFCDIIPDTEKERAFFERLGIATMWPDYDHSVPDWDRIFKLGFNGILKESQAMETEISKTRTLNESELAFFEGIRITYSAIIDFINRLYLLAEKTPGSEKMATALKNIAKNPPSNFYEALLIDYIYFMLCEHIEGLNGAKQGRCNSGNSFNHKN